MYESFTLRESLENSAYAALLFFELIILKWKANKTFNAIPQKL